MYVIKFSLVVTVGTLICASTTKSYFDTYFAVQYTYLVGHFKLMKMRPSEHSDSINARNAKRYTAPIHVRQNSLVHEFIGGT